MTTPTVPDKPELTDDCQLRFDEDDVPILHYGDGHEKLDNIDYRILQLADGDHTVEEIIKSLEDTYDGDDFSGKVTGLFQIVASLGLLVEDD